MIHKEMGIKMRSLTCLALSLAMVLALTPLPQLANAAEADAAEKIEPDGVSVAAISDSDNAIEELKPDGAEVAATNEVTNELKKLTSTNSNIETINEIVALENLASNDTPVINVATPIYVTLGAEVTYNLGADASSQPDIPPLTSSVTFQNTGTAYARMAGITCEDKGATTLFTKTDGAPIDADNKIFSLSNGAGGSVSFGPVSDTDAASNANTVGTTDLGASFDIPDKSDSATSGEKTFTYTLDLSNTQLNTSAATNLAAGGTVSTDLASVAYTFEAAITTITWDENYAGGTTFTTTPCVSSTPISTLPTPTRTGYTFDGWYASSDLSGEEVTEVSTTDASNKTYYAKWAPITYNLTYDGNGGTSGEATSISSSCVYDTTYTIADNAFEKENYTFVCWNTEPDGTGTDYAVEEEVANLCTSSGDTFTLYAKWLGTYVALYGNTLVLGKDTRVPPTYGGVSRIITFDAGDKLETTASYSASSLPEWCNYYGFITKVVVVDEVQPISLSSYFACLENATAVDAAKLNTTNVTDMSYMFYGCSSLSTLDFSTWNTSNIYDMTAMFYECSSLEALDVSGWTTTNVASMAATFCGCFSLGALDVSEWDTTNVTNMYRLFYDCSSLEALNVSSWDTANVVDMYEMFCECSSLGALDVSKWDTTNVTDMCEMFCDCSSLKALDVSKWTTTNVEDMMAMFYGCESLESLDLSKWTTDAVTKLSYMFTDCISLKTIGDITSWNTSSLSGSLEAMFFGCSSLAVINLSSLNTTNVTSFQAMFSGCESLETIGDISGWSTTNVINLSYMFNGCSSLATLNLSNFKTGSVTDMCWMFTDCGCLETVGNLVNWDTSSVENMQNMFYGCFVLSEIGDISGWVTVNVTAMDGMFCDCECLVANCSGWDTTAVTEYTIFNDNALSVTAPAWVN